jgi:hypothetical protein
MQPQQPDWPAGPQPPNTPDYGFIMSPDQPSKRKGLPGGNSLAVRIGAVSVGLIVLIILFAIVKSLFGGSNNFDSFVAIAKKQQQIIHLSESAGEQKSLPESLQNTAITTELNMTTDQSNTISYLRTNKVKVKSKTLNAGVSASLDSQLEAAASANNYTATFKLVMHDQLESYLEKLQQTYSQTNGANGRKLLSQQYDHAKLLLDQLDQP